MTTKKREPILLSDESGQFDTYLRKLRSCEKECAKFKTVFNTVVTENLSVGFTKEWIKITIDGQLEDRLYDELTAFLSKQPKLMHKAITEEFYRIMAPLNEAANTLKYAFEELPYQDKIMGRMFPSDLVEFQSLPFDNLGVLSLSDEWQATIKESFKVWVKTDLEFEKYDLFNDVLALRAKFKEVHKEKAPYLWMQLTQSNDITINLTINSII